MLLSRANNFVRRGSRRAFTLIELIFVMVLLAIGAAMVAPRMGDFFRGRVVSSEARRMLSLVHYGQSRAISEGVPVLLWINTKDSTYGLRTQSSYSASSTDDDLKSTTYATDSTVTLDTPSPDTSLVSEQDDEKLGLTDGLPVIRFTPDGFYDQISVRKVIFRSGGQDTLELGQTPNRLSYEIRPYSASNL